MADFQEDDVDPATVAPEFLSRYAHKIVSVEDLRSRLGPPPRSERLVMCHGVFDVVHPGHIRHLLYARSKGTMLVASITADRHIDKGVYRPHVPQQIRAANLAAFEFVDFVIIDNEKTPLTNLGILQPDVYAKGYEYSDAIASNPKTEAEARLVSGYGGEILFTPGDIVYSSSALLTMTAPRLGPEKLAQVMTSRQLSSTDLLATLDAFGEARTHVVGDTIIDSFSYCSMIGGQTKTPTMSVSFRNRVDCIGGAAIVALHLRAAGADVHFTTLLGDDTFGELVSERLAAEGVGLTAIVDRQRPTTQKNAIIAGGYRLLKVDTLDNTPISDTQVEAIAASLNEHQAGAVIFSDFRHGLFHRRSIPRLVGSIPANSLKIGDSQVASRWGNVLDFQGFDLLTPNEREARFALADQDMHVRNLASTLHERSRCRALMVKLGERGIIVTDDPRHESYDSFFVLDSFTDNCVDAVGAGDALLAYASLALQVSGNVAQAAILGNLAAACECEVEGNVPIAVAEVRSRLIAMCRELGV